MNTQQSDTIELGQVARALASGWRAIVGFTLFGVAAAVAIILFAPRKYTGITTLVLKTGSTSGGSSVLSQVSGLGDLTAGLLGGKSPMETEIEVLQSRAVIGDVIDSLFLQAKVTGKAALPARNVIAALSAPGSFTRRVYRFERVAGGQRYLFTGDGMSGEMVPGTPTRLSVGSITFSPTTVLPPAFELLLRDKADATLWVSKHLKVAKEKGEVASITYRGDDSLTVARVPNILLTVYLGRRRGTDRGINQRRVEFLTAKSDSMERALALAASTLRRQQEASGMLDPMTTAKVELESGATLRAKLFDVLVQQGALKHLMDQINAKTLNPSDLAAYPGFTTSPIINGLVSQLQGMATERTRRLADHAPTDGDIVALDSAAAAVEARIIPFARTYADALERQRIDLQASLDKINRTLAALPRAAESSGHLEAEVLGLTKLLGGLQGQIVEAKLAAIGEGGDVRPLDLAIEPKSPSFPNPLITASLGTFGGLFCGLIAALLIGSVGRWMRDPIEIERTTGVPALQFDPAVPLLLSNGASRTIVVAPIDAGVSVTAVVNRLAQTAASRSLSAAVLNLPDTATDVNGSIARLEAEHDLVIVQLPSLVSDTAAAALQHTRPVLLVAPGRRIERRRLVGAVQMLKRLEVPVAGIVMSNGSIDGRALPR